MKVRYKVWLEKDGEPIISEGKYRLLKAIEREGSIVKAAESLGISYKRAHSQIKAIEERLGRVIIERRRRRGACLTEEGKRLINEYEAVAKEFDRLASRLNTLQSEK
ncbi:LysR family transcriptional regulator [Hydrogenivirga sp. 128-5-R1-1]|uniref:winged helix-turn-helix domain-containing protein n=1 Tax=Hydrogenivirga sp. 128-5-R1-1 TaxID=392423 RepID=UPI00015F17E6|nr:LysR family transcriptional regulator [Hydrogenivirga sp. 128-5-R1-1]EDP76006.1 molybdenum-pterin binding domain [Hydrogenivirga sp. 128-5-R1-1]